MNKDILQLIKIEERAREVRNQLDRIESRWDKTFQKAKNSKEWHEYCRQAGIVENYRFGDVLC